MMQAAHLLHLIKQLVAVEYKQLVAVEYIAQSSLTMHKTYRYTETNGQSEKQGPSHGLGCITVNTDDKSDGKISKP